MFNKKLIINLLILTNLLVYFSYGLELEKINNHLYFVKGKTGLPSNENKGLISNSFAVLTKEGWFVIDSLSTPALSKEFIAKIKNVKNIPIKYLVITHYHLDHYFGTSSYKKQNTKIIANKNLLKLIDSGYIDNYLENIKKLFGSLFNNVEIVKPNIAINEKKVINLGEYTFEIIPVNQSHTNTDLIVYIKQTKEIFVGDLVFYNRIPFVADTYSNSKNWLETLDFIKSFEISKLYNGHNSPLDKSAINFTYEYINFLRTKISNMKDEGLFYDEIKQKLQNTKWKVYPMFDVFHNKNVYKIYNDLDFEF